MKKITILLSVILVILLVGGCAPNNSDPVRLAEASRINTQADMDVARQNAALAQANQLAQAQAQAVIIEAQAKADAARNTANTWVIVIAVLLGIPLVGLVVALIIFARKYKRQETAKELSRQIRFYIFPISNGRYRFTDEYGNSHILDDHNPADARLLEEALR